MIRVSLDKISSTTKNLAIKQQAFITHDIVAKAGWVVAVKVLSDKAVYNHFENVEGRMTRLKPGDVIAGVLGHRSALRGYVGVVPEQISPGDVLQVLNLGGVIGRCTSYAPDVGKPFDVEVLGAILEFPYLGQRVGVPATIVEHAIEEADVIEESAPLIIVVGTCMDSGKTLAACEIIHRLTHKGKKIAAGKLTGVALQRDVLGMLDHGAIEALSFVDAGVVSTDETTAPLAARRIIKRLNQAAPDAIVLELGDGLLGEYGVQALLNTQDLVAQVRSVVLCASDPVGAWGGVRLLRDEHQLTPDVITGPTTDNDVGGLFIRSCLKVPTVNALSAPEVLVERIYQKVFSDD